MNLAVRNYKQCNGRDGVAFSATILRDGKPIGEVTQEGSGGCNFYHFKEEHWKTLKELEAFAKEQTGEDFEPLDQLVETLIEKYELNKYAKRIAKKGAVAAILCKAEEDPNLKGFYHKQFYVGLRRREDAEAVAKKHGAVVYVISDE